MERANRYKRCSQNHRTVVEGILGKPLPKGSVVHHIDGDTKNNVPSNLVVLPNEAYHKALHARQRIQELGYDWREYKVCGRCGIKPRTEFTKDKTSWDGTDVLCKDCKHEHYKSRTQRAS